MKNKVITSPVDAEVIFAGFDTIETKLVKLKAGEHVRIPDWATGYWFNDGEKLDFRFLDATSS